MNSRGRDNTRDDTAQTGQATHYPCVSEDVRRLLGDLFRLKSPQQDSAVQQIAVASSGMIPTSSRAKYLSWPQLRWVSDPQSRSFNRARELEHGIIRPAEQRKPSVPKFEPWNELVARNRHFPGKTRNFRGVPWLIGTKNPFAVLDFSEPSRIPAEGVNKTRRKFPHSRVGKPQTQRFKDQLAYSKLKSENLSLKQENERLIRALSSKSGEHALTEQLNTLKHRVSTLEQELTAKISRIQELESSPDWEDVSDTEEPVTLTNDIMSFPNFSVDDNFGEVILEASRLGPMNDGVRRALQTFRLDGRKVQQLYVVLHGDYFPESGQFVPFSPKAGTYFHLEIMGQLIAQCFPSISRECQDPNTRSWIRSFLTAGQFMDVRVEFTQAYSQRVTTYHSSVSASVITKEVDNLFTADKGYRRTPTIGGFSPSELRIPWEAMEEYGEIPVGTRGTRGSTLKFTKGKAWRKFIQENEKFLRQWPPARVTNKVKRVSKPFVQNLDLTNSVKLTSGHLSSWPDLGDFPRSPITDILTKQVNDESFSFSGGRLITDMSVYRNVLRPYIEEYGGTICLSIFDELTCRLLQKVESYQILVEGEKRSMKLTTL